MTQKKQTTNQQLAEMREMLTNMAPGKVVSIDRELQEQNSTLMRLLYGAVAKHGMVPENEQNVIAIAHLPVLQPPANHQLIWKIIGNGSYVSVSIIRTLG